MTQNARDLLFDGYEVRYHQIAHVRLRVYENLLAAEQQMLTDGEVNSAINALPLLERCRELAIKSCRFGMRPARPAVPPSEGNPGSPAEPEREFSLDAKTTAVMMMATNSKSFGDEEAREALANMHVDPGAADAFSGMVQLVAMSRATSDHVPLATLALRERGEVKGPDEEWVPLKDQLTEADMRRLPQELTNKVREFLMWEQTGWPKANQMAQPGKQPRREPRSSSK
jgi:hypothetical protein